MLDETKQDGQLSSLYHRYYNIYGLYSNITTYIVAIRCPQILIILYATVRSECDRHIKNTLLKTCVFITRVIANVAAL